VVKDQREECKVAEGVEAERCLDEGKKYVEQGDLVQASEKFYKAAEEAVKVLARRFALPEHEEAESRGRRTAALLFSAVRRLSERVTLGCELVACRLVPPRRRIPRG
jgi:hypothetical protein